MSDDRTSIGGKPQAPLRGAVIGRRVGRGIHFAIAGAVCVAVVVELTAQVFHHENTVVPYSNCHAAVRGLYEAVERGRAAADRGVDEPRDEAALVQYRETVEADWRHLDGIRALCSADPTSVDALGLLERLRYAEEHGVRSAATELSSLRRRARERVQALTGPRGSVAPR